MSKFDCDEQQKKQKFLYANMTTHQRKKADEARLFHAKQLTKTMWSIINGDAIQYVGETKTQKKTAKKAKPPVAQKAYRGFSTVNPDNQSFQQYDLSLIKQNLIKLKKL
mgnify:CR=1 FL=1